MRLDLCVANDKCNIGEIFALEHPKKIFRHLRFWHLHSYRQHPDVVETQFTIITSENIELSFHDIGSVSATWSWLEFASDNFLPVIAFNIEDMHIIHPMNSVITTEINDLGIDQAPSCRNTGAWLITTHDGLHPRQSFSIQVKDIIELPELIRLSPKDINFLIESYR